MIYSFKKYLSEDSKTLYFTFGRMNPPTIGHGLLLDKLVKMAKGNPYRIYLSQSNDAKKNPLTYVDKVKFVRKMFPKYARSIMLDKNVKNVLDAATAMFNEGYQNIVMVVGADRVIEFETLLNKYNGQDSRHGFYNFKSISVVSIGDRDPDSEGVQGASATKQRQYAGENDFVRFSQGVPMNFSNKDSRDLFNAVRKGMGLAESTSYRNHIDLGTVSDIREKYVSGQLFNVGDKVIIKETSEKATVLHLGANYLVLEKEDGSVSRKWLDAIVEASIPKELDPKLPLSKQVALAQKRIDKDNDGDVDNLDKNTPDELIGTEKDSIAKMQKKYSGEKQHTKIGNPYESKDSKITSPQDPDIKDKEGSQPKRFFKGIKTDSTKSKRDAHFKKYGKMADDNPAAYKPAPGDASSKTKESQYTKKYRQMYGENAMDATKKRIEAEKKADAVKHDNMIDRARLALARAKNKATNPND